MIGERGKSWTWVFPVRTGVRGGGERGVLGDGYFQHQGVFGFDQLWLRGVFTTQKRYFLAIREFLLVLLLKATRVGPIPGFKFQSLYPGSTFH